MELTLKNKKVVFVENDYLMFAEDEEKEKWQLVAKNEYEYFYTHGGKDYREACNLIWERKENLYLATDEFANNCHRAGNVFHVFDDACRDWYVVSEEELATFGEYLSEDYATAWDLWSEGGYGEIELGTLADESCPCGN